MLVSVRKHKSPNAVGLRDRPDLFMYRTSRTALIRALFNPKRKVPLQPASESSALRRDEDAMFLMTSQRADSLTIPASDAPTWIADVFSFLLATEGRQAIADLVARYGSRWHAAGWLVLMATRQGYGLSAAQLDTFRNPEALVDQIVAIAEANMFGAFPETNRASWWTAAVEPTLRSSVSLAAIADLPDGRWVLAWSEKDRDLADTTGVRALQVRKTKHGVEFTAHVDRMTASGPVAVVVCDDRGVRDVLHLVPAAKKETNFERNEMVKDLAEGVPVVGQQLKAGVSVSQYLAASRSEIPSPNALSEVSATLQTSSPNTLRVTLATAMTLPGSASLLSVPEVVDVARTAALEAGLPMPLIDEVTMRVYEEAAAPSQRWMFRPWIDAQIAELAQDMEMGVLPEERPHLERADDERLADTAGTSSGGLPPSPTVTVQFDELSSELNATPSDPPATSVDGPLAYGSAADAS